MLWLADRGAASGRAGKFSLSGRQTLPQQDAAPRMQGQALAWG